MSSAFLSHDIVSSVWSWTGDIHNLDNLSVQVVKNNRGHRGFLMTIEDMARHFNTPVLMMRAVVTYMVKRKKMHRADLTEKFDTKRGRPKNLYVVPEITMKNM